MPESDENGVSDATRAWIRELLESPGVLRLERILLGVEPGLEPKIPKGVTHDALRAAEEGFGDNDEEDTP